MTVHHLTEAFFDSPERARHRLNRLYRMRVVDRFRPFIPQGTSPFHYCLDAVGEMACGAEKIRTKSDNPSLAARWKRSQRLEHRLAINGFFTSLMGVERRSDGYARLIDWWSEARCIEAMGGLVYPDGYGVWREGKKEVSFYLEVDRGTESVEVLRKKLEGYVSLEKATGVQRPVLFWFESPQRENSARKKIANGLVPIATATAGRAPSTAMWCVNGSASQLALVDLIPNS